MFSCDADVYAYMRAHPTWSLLDTLVTFDVYVQYMCICLFSSLSLLLTPCPSTITALHYTTLHHTTPHYTTLH